MNEIIDSNPSVSVLWPGAPDDDATRDDLARPDCFHDLNLDQVEEALTHAWPEENLAAFFRAPLPTVAAVEYRQAVLKDLERTAVRDAAYAFVRGLRDVRSRIASIDKRYYPYEKERVFLGAAAAYRAAIEVLAHELAQLQLESAGLQRLNAYLADYTASAAFLKFAADVDHLLHELGEIRYDLLVRSGSVTVRAYADERDAGLEVQQLFAKFRNDASGDATPAAHGHSGLTGLNHIDAQVLDRVALLYPEAFAELDAFCDHYETFIDPVAARFAREVCFYLAWLQFIRPLQLAGLPFCHPAVSAESKAVMAEDGFDIALAMTLGEQRRAIVRNGFALGSRERILVVSGPNNGGKTTFARMFGQLHWLAALGLNVPAASARLFLFDHLFTHFEKEEAVETLRGKLQDDLVRIHAILERATSRSVVILNEIFSSTTLEDGVRLARNIMAKISRLDALAMCVTFLVELADYDDKTVSMVAAIDPDDPARRTFKVERRPADGLAYALAVARKYRVTHDALLQRIAP